MKANMKWIGLFVFAAACGNGAPATQEGVLAQWKEAGLEVSAFAATDAAGYGGGTCQTGLVSGLETTLCQHPQPDQAKAVRDVALKKVGSATGYALVNEKWVLVVADRNKVDRSGKTMNQLALAFQGRPKAL